MPDKANPPMPMAIFWITFAFVGVLILMVLETTAPAPTETMSSVAILTMANGFMIGSSFRGGVVIPTIVHVILANYDVIPCRGFDFRSSYRGSVIQLREQDRLSR